MKKKIILALIVLSVSISACGNEKGNKESETATNQEAKTKEDSETKEEEKKEPEKSPDSEKQQEDNSLSAERGETPKETEEETSENIEALGDINVEKGIFDIELTIPAEYVGETTQEELDKDAAEYGYKVTLNSDGTATYKMTKSQHEKILEDMAESFNQELDKMIGSEEYPNFTKIESNDNFTEFKVTTKSTELDMNESFSVIAFYMYGGLYGTFSGKDADNVSVTFINEESGEIIDVSNSSDMEESEQTKTE